MKQNLKNMTRKKRNRSKEEGEDLCMAKTSTSDVLKLRKHVVVVPDPL